MKVSTSEPYQKVDADGVDAAPGSRPLLVESEFYRMGFDCGLHGPNAETNCAFRLFDTPEHTREWEQGHAAGFESFVAGKPLQAQTEPDRGQITTDPEAQNKEGKHS